MSMTDPVADMLTRIRNGSRARHTTIELPSSKIKTEIARILKQEGYIDDYEVTAENAHSTLRLELRYGDERRSAITGVRRISRPGRRVYAKRDEIPRVLGGLGVAILSTPRGLVTGKDATREGVGGEVVCYVW